MDTLGSFRKSSYSEINNVLHCVEVGAPGPVAVRDTKEAGQDGRTVLQFGGSAWTEFLAQVR